MIGRAPHDVFVAVTDITRMGEWSPECVAARWVPPATAATVGARFEGDNVAKVGPFTVKRWTTTSEVTTLVPDELFEFVAEGHTRWRYEFVEIDGATRLSESYEHPDHVGWQNFVYNTLGRRRTAMVKGMQDTLDRIKAVLESNA